MDSIDKPFDSKIKSKEKKVPPLVLPKSDTDNFYSAEFKSRLKYFTASSNGFKWDKTNINSKTNKFLARNGFNSLFWSAIIIDDQIIPLIIELFKDNIKFITDEEFEPTFGLSLNTSADISLCQLLANYYLLFGIPAKCHTQYLQEWTKRRLEAFYRMIFWSDQPDFDSHPELFVATKRRFYVYKHLVPSLTLFAIDSFNKRKDIMKSFFEQVKLGISYSGLQSFYFSWSNINNDFYEVFELQAIKEDINRITAARKVIVEKYGENRLPFARLLNYPEVEGLDRRNYPDLAFVAHYLNTKTSTQGVNSWNNFTFRKVKTKTPTNELKRLANIRIPFDLKSIPPLTDEQKEIFKSLGISFPTFDELTDIFA